MSAYASFHRPIKVTKKHSFLFVFFAFCVRFSSIVFVLLLVILEAIYSIYSVKITDLTNDIYRALANVNPSSTLAPFIVPLFGLSCVVYFSYSLSNYLTEYLSIKGAQEIITGLKKRWYDQKQINNTTNLDQRIIDDSYNFTSIFMQLFHNLVRSFSLIICFIKPLCSISQSAYNNKWVLPVIAIALSICSSLLSRLIRLKLTNKENIFEEKSANLRACAKNSQLYWEQIVLLKGQSFENQQMHKRLLEFVNMKLILIKYYFLYWFCFGLYEKLNAMFALFLLSPCYFKGLITLGAMQQAGVVFYYISNSFSFWAGNVCQIAKFFTAKQRLMEFENGLTWDLLEHDALKETAKINMPIAHQVIADELTPSISNVRKTTINELTGAHEVTADELTPSISNVRKTTINELTEAYKANPVTSSDTNNFYIRLEFVTVGESTLSKTILHNVNLEFKKNEKIHLKGKIGVGKTTLLKIIGGIHTNYKGHCNIPDDIFCSFTDIYMPLSANLYEVIAYPKFVVENKSIDSGYKADGHEYFSQTQVQLAMDAVNLKWINDPNMLSMGEKQKILFAKLLLFKPQFIFLDEPVSFLDSTTALDLINMLYNHLPNSCIVIISHSMVPASRIIDLDVF